MFVGGVNAVVLTLASCLLAYSNARSNLPKHTLEQIRMLSTENKADLILSIAKRGSSDTFIKPQRLQKRYALQEYSDLRKLLIHVLEDCYDHRNDERSMGTTSTGTTFDYISTEQVTDSSMNDKDVVPDLCKSENIVNLTESWRKELMLKPNEGEYACDIELQEGKIWFRFTGTAGTQLSNKCRPSYSCGGHGGFWSNAEMPSRVGEMKKVPIYGSWSGDCNWYNWPTVNPLTVMRCSSEPGDFIYQVHGTPSCHWTFCGMDV